MRYLKEIFSRFGFPKVLLSDNATILKLYEFQKFCAYRDITQKCWYAPGYPSTNGQAERFCQILKRKLKSVQDEPAKIQDKVTFC